MSAQRQQEELSEAEKKKRELKWSEFGFAEGRHGVYHVRVHSPKDAEVYFALGFRGFVTGRGVTILGKGLRDFQATEAAVKHNLGELEWVDEEDGPTSLYGLKGKYKVLPGKDEKYSLTYAPSDINKVDRVDGFSSPRQAQEMAQKLERLLRHEMILDQRASKARLNDLTDYEDRPRRLIWTQDFMEPSRFQAHGDAGEYVISPSTERAAAPGKRQLDVIFLSHADGAKPSLLGRAENYGQAVSLCERHNFDAPQKTGFMVHRVEKPRK